MNKYICIIIFLFNYLSAENKACSFDVNGITVNTFCVDNEKDKSLSVERLNITLNLGGQNSNENEFRKFHSDTLERFENRKKNSEAAYSIGHEFSSENESIETWSNVRKGIADGAQIVGDAVSDFTSPGIPGVNASKIIKHGARAGSTILRHFDDYRVKSLKSKNKKKHNDAVKLYLKDQFNSGHLTVDDFAELSPEGLKQLADQMYKDFDLDFSSMNGWTQESQNNLTNTMVSQLAKFQTSSSINLFKELNKSSEKINDVNSSINNHIESFKDFVDDFQENSKDLKENMGNLNNALDEYIESQSELNKSMSEIKDNILKGSQSLDEIGEDVRFLKAVTMGGMSATQLKEMIELDILNLENMQQVEGHNGFIQSIDKYKKQLDTLAKVEDVQNRANEISKYAQSISNLANNLGIIDDKTAGDVNTALSAISSGVNIYAGVMTSNPLMVLDGASSLSGLFGKKEPSIEEKRHQQIIQGINKLLKGQEIILEAIASLGEILSEMSKQISSQFNKVYENQKIILDVLISIDEKLTKMHNQEMNKLFEIHYSVLVNREMINYLAFNDIYGACSTFYRKIREYPFNNYQNFSFIFNANVDYFKKCYDGLSTVFQFHDLESSGGFPFSNALKFSWHAKDINGDKFVHQSYMPLYKLVLKYGKKYGYSIEQVFDSSFYPVTSFDDLEKKINNLDKLKISNDFYGKNVSFNKSSTLKSIIHPQAVLNMTDALSRLHGYLNLVDVRNKELMSEKKFLEGQVISNRGEELAFVGLKSIETSIAQLNFLSGDLSLKIIDSIFNEAMTKLNESDKDEKNTYNIAKDKSYILALNTFLLNDNLFKNYLIYRIRRQLKKQDMNFISYKMALNDNNGDLLLKSILNLPWKVVKEERGWFVIVEKFVNSASHEKDLIKIKMPSSVDVEQGIIKYNFSLPLLVKRKQILKNIILGYRIPRNILKSKKNSKEIKRAFLDYLILSNLEGK